MKAKTKQKSLVAAATTEVSRSYNAHKQFDGQHYTGMQVGRSHKWNYDKGVWRETKITPDRWEIITTSPSEEPVMLRRIRGINWISIPLYSFTSICREIKCERLFNRDDRIEIQTCS